MTTPEELEGFRRERYFARSWALLTKDRGWIKPVLVMTVAVLVPIVGVLGVIGYLYEWARLTAWGVNAAPKQRGVRIGACIASGWRAFVVALVWTIVSGIVLGIVAVLPVIGPIVSLLWTIINSVLALVIMVAALRATIYQRIWGGLRVSTIWKMVSHDPVGLLRIAGIEILGGIIIGVVTTIALLPALFSIIPSLITMVEYLEYSSVLSSGMQARIAMQSIFSMLSSIGPTVIVLILVCGFIGTILSLVCVNATALWMRQFNVAAWGRDEDPLPPFVSDPRDVAQPGSSWQYGIPQQPVSATSPVEPNPASNPSPAPAPAPAEPQEPAEAPQAEVPEKDVTPFDAEDPK